VWHHRQIPSRRRDNRGPRRYDCLGTARLGDFVLRPTNLSEDVNAQTDADLWLGIQCPPKGDRWGSYAIWYSKTKPGYLIEATGTRSLYQLFGVKPAEKSRPSQQSQGQQGARDTR